MVECDQNVQRFYLIPARIPEGATTRSKYRLRIRNTIRMVKTVTYPGIVHKYDLMNMAEFLAISGGSNTTRFACETYHNVGKPVGGSTMSMVIPAASTANKPGNISLRR